MPEQKYENATPGNVYAINTADGYGFFQCVSKSIPGIDIIRVLQPILLSIEDFHPSMVEGKGRYFIKFVVCIAEKRKMISFVGTYPVPRHGRTPGKFRSLDYVPHKNIRRWYEVREIFGHPTYRFIPKPNEKFFTLSGHGIWNSALLIDRLEQGWTLQDWR